MSFEIIASPLTASLAGALAVVATGALLAARSQVQGTTLAAAWKWTLAAVWAIAGVEIFIGLIQPSLDAIWVSPLRFAGAAFSFCPLMSLLGAKRPQDGPWQFIVFSLWVVLVLPAAEASFLRPMAEFELQGVRSWFLLVLILLGLVNHLPTRHAPASLLAAVAQGLLLGAHLPFKLESDGAGAALAGLGAGVAAVAVAAWGRASSQGNELNVLWRDFRDSFGVFWALRMAERVNAVAVQHRWPLRLRWTGFVAVSEADSVAPGEMEKTLHAALRNLLRRFVSDAWIARRLHGSINLREMPNEPVTTVARKEHPE